MAARSDEIGESIAHENSSFYVVNGEEKQLSNNSQGDGGHLPTLESMLEAATDLQSDHIDQPTSKISGRLEMRHDIVENHPAVPNAGATSLAPQPSVGQYIQTSSGGYGYSKPVTEQGAGPVLVRADTSAKVEALKKWTISAYKCTKQLVSEKLGRRAKTVDEELEKRIESLRETQRKYANVLKLARQLTQNFHAIIQTQKLMAEDFMDLSMKAPELQDEFTQNGDLQKVLVKNGETLLNALGFFTTNLATLCNKTIEDTIQTVKAYESCRIEYDAYRSDMEISETSGVSQRVEEARKEFSSQREKYEKVRQDLQIKMKFLEENKVKVMRKQLLLFHNAVAAYFAGNKKELENTMKEFHIRVQNKGEGSSFLEQH
eukprot:gene628-10327_t